jgi:hypothetical protein
MAAFVTILLLSNVLGAGKVARSTCRDRPVAVRRRHPVLPHLLRDRRRADRGLRLCPRAALHLGGLRALLFMAFMSWVVVALPPAPTGRAGGLRAGVRPGAADRLRLDVAFWAGEFANSYVLARMKVWTEGGTCGPHDRLDRRRAGRRQPDLLPARLLRRGDGETAAQGAAHPVGAEGRLGSAADAGHLRGGRLAQAPRGRRRLRRARPTSRRSSRPSCASPSWRPG